MKASYILVNVERSVVDLGRGAIERLIQNIAIQMRRAGLTYSIDGVYSDRIAIEVHHNLVEQCVEVLRRVFGIRSISPAIKTSVDLDTIASGVCSLLSPGDRVSIDVLCVGCSNQSDLSSALINSVGGCLEGVELSSTSYSKRISVEILDDGAYIYSSSFSGAGGIPYGFMGRVASLVSGGIDSSIATWIAMRMGFSVTPIHFSLRPFYGEDAWNRALDSLKWLREWVAEDAWEAYIVPLGLIHSEVEVAPSYRCILCKMLMYRISWALAKRVGCRAIVTGEALGQVASQTLHNLRFLSEHVGIPVLRPLIAFDKDEIARLGRALGLDRVVLKKVKSCTLYPSLWGRHAVTNADGRVYRNIEEGIKRSRFRTIDNLVNYALENTVRIRL